MVRDSFGKFVLNEYREKGLTGLVSDYASKAWEQRYWTTGLLAVTTPVLTCLESAVGLTPEQSLWARGLTLLTSYPANPILRYGRDRAQEKFNDGGTFLGKLKADTVTGLPLTVVLKGGLFGALYYAIGVDDPRQLSIAIGAALVGSMVFWNAAFATGDYLENAFLGSKPKKWALGVLGASLLLTAGAYSCNDNVEDIPVVTEETF